MKGQLLSLRGFLVQSGVILLRHYNFEMANVELLLKHFDEFETESIRMIETGYPTIAYDFAVRASHTFNLLDARSAISTTARVGLMHRIRDLCCASAKLYLKKREDIGFPLIKHLSTELEAKQNNPTLPEIRVDSRVGPSTCDDLLIEIGSEHLPAKFIPPALESFEKSIRKFFKEKNLSFDSLEMFGTPRRLAVILNKVAGGTAPEVIERKGPSIDIAFDQEGKLTKQGLGFMLSIGLSEVTKEQVLSGKIDLLSIKDNKYLFAKVKKKGSATTQIIQDALPKIIENITFKKKMRWGSRSEMYARPIKWLTVLYGKTIIPISYAGIVSSNVTYGHEQIDQRVIKLTHPKQYKKKLKKHCVLASVPERKNLIDKQLDKYCAKLGTTLPQRDCVMSEVLFLSEYPLVGSYDFDEKYLDLPPELLISEMIDHQRYFPLLDSDGKLIPKFLVAVDKKPTDLILQNNGAVLRARLNDGLFLFEQDLKRSLESFNDDLKKVVFHKDLGTIYEKSVRVKDWSEKLAKLLGKSSPTRAAELCKADLATAVVYEFPDLQGKMGKHYALIGGENTDVATAINEHWWPLTEGGSIPTTESGSILALADKFDNLDSYLRIGIKPSSSKDPYALRRAAIGILRILIENKYSLSLEEITSPDVVDYILQRLRNVLYDYGYNKEEVEAVMSCGANNPYNIFCRTQALHTFRKSSTDFETLHQVYKRARGQIENESEKSFHISLLEDENEKTLACCLDNIKPLLDDAISKRDYATAFKTLTELSEPLSHFFDNVRVLADDPKVRDNRIALLQQVFYLTSKLVDFTKL